MDSCFLGFLAAYYMKNSNGLLQQDADCPEKEDSESRRRAGERSRECIRRKVRKAIRTETQKKGKKEIIPDFI